MAQDHLKTILTYVRDVLGVEAFAPAVRLKPYIFIGAYSGSPTEVSEMQTRMVAALKLNVSDFEFINVEQTNVQPEVINAAQVVVVFGEETKQSLSLSSLVLGEVKVNGSQRMIFTHSLTDLAKSAPLKKETWTHLQSVF